MIVLGIAYSEPALNSTHQGGTPYGASHVSGAKHQNEITVDEKTLAIAQGKRLAVVAKALITNVIMAKKIKDTTPKPVYPIHQRLKWIWWAWLMFRLLAIAVFTSLLLPAKPNMMGGMVWQGLWLVPALLATPYIVKGKSPYALLLLSMVTFVYLGVAAWLPSSMGLVIFWGMMGVWLVDFVL